jgi:hypothetical protein
MDFVFMMHFGRITLNFIVLPIGFNTLENALIHYKKIWINNFDNYKIAHPVIPFSILDFQYSAKIVRFKPVKKLFFIILKNAINKKNIMEQRENINLLANQKLFYPIPSFSIYKYPEFTISYFYITNFK